MSEPDSSVPATAVPEKPLPARRFLNGRLVVAAMFLMGFGATGLLYTYWTLHLMPFMPLQEAIVAEFPGSAPRVDGGQRKSHKQTPTILRIVMKSKVDPTSTDADSLEAMKSLRARVAELVEAKVDFPGMDFIELHVYKLLQEKEIREKSHRLDLKPGSEWYEINEKGDPVTPVASPAPATIEASSSVAPSSEPAP